MLHAEAVLLVYDEKPYVFKRNVFLKKPVRAYDYVNFPLSEFAYSIFLLFFGAESA